MKTLWKHEESESMARNPILSTAMGIVMAACYPWTALAAEKLELNCGPKYFLRTSQLPTGEMIASLGWARPQSDGKVLKAYCSYYKGKTFDESGRPGEGAENIHVYQGLWDHCSMTKILVFNRRTLVVTVLRELDMTPTLTLSCGQSNTPKTY